jgi:hypothetical protein
MPTPSCLWPQRAEEAHFEVGFANLHEAQQAEFGPLFRSMSAKTHHAWDTSTTDRFLNHPSSRPKTAPSNQPFSNSFPAVSACVGATLVC